MEENCGQVPTNNIASDNCMSLNVDSLKKEPKDDDEEQIMESRANIDQSINLPEVITFKKEYNYSDDEHSEAGNETQTRSFTKIDEFKKERENSDDEQSVESEEMKPVISTNDEIEGPKEEIKSEFVDVKIEVNEVSLETADIKLKDEKTFPGNIASTSMKRLESFRKNKKKRKEILYECMQCDFTTNRTDLLNEHLVIHNTLTVERFDCDQCKYSTTVESYLILHKRIHNTDKPFHCKLCPKYFNRRRNLKMHMNRHHPDQCQEKMKVLQCDRCSYSSVHSGVFKRHKLTHGDTLNLTKYVCDKCEYSTFLKHAITRHKLTHTGERPFLCKLCNYGSNQLSCLKKHIQAKHDKRS